MRRVEYICILFISFVLIICLTGCSIKTVETEEITSKIYEELNYLDSKYSYLIKEILEDESDWKNIKDEIIRLNEDFDIIFLDISELDFSNEELSNFKNNIDNLIDDSMKEDSMKLLLDIDESILNLAKVFEKNGNINESKLKDMKSKVLLSYIYYLNDENEQYDKLMDGIMYDYENVIKDYEFLKMNQFNMNKLYLKLKDYSNLIESKNNELIKIKLVKIMDEI